METISALADAIIDAGWKSPQQIEQAKTTDERNSTT